MQSSILYQNSSYWYVFLMNTMYLYCKKCVFLILFNLLLHWAIMLSITSASCQCLSEVMLLPWCQLNYYALSQVIASCKSHTTFSCTFMLEYEFKTEHRICIICRFCLAICVNYSCVQLAIHNTLNSSDGIHTLNLNRKTECTHTFKEIVYHCIYV